jgi:hypothetical protein
MLTLTRSLIAAVLGLSAVAAQAQPSPTAEPFAVFVDRPTGFAFINTSVGWKYVNTLSAQQMERLHPSTLLAVGPHAPVDVQAFDVFVDRPTGNAYVRTPTAWHFVRTLDAAQLRQLPLTTLTRLVEPVSAEAPTALASR